MSMTKNEMVAMLRRNNLVPPEHEIEKWTKKHLAEHMGVYNAQTRHVNEKDFERACFRLRKNGGKI